MLGAALVYAATFLGLFTALVSLLTLLEPTPHVGRARRLPSVSLIIPVWNEGGTNARLRRTLESVLALDYPRKKLQVIVIDDGSTDDSARIARSFGQRVQVRRHQRPKGKTAAINTGLRVATGALVAAVDADTILSRDVLRKLVPCFTGKVMAAIPSIKIWQPRGLLQRVQFQEFLSAVFVRHVQAALGAIPLAPGAFTLVRREFLERHGGYDNETMVEDLELSLRIQSKQYLIEHVPDANVYTAGVTSLRAFFRQRTRWFFGFIVQLLRYRKLFSTRYGNLGVFILPSAVGFVLLSILLLFSALVTGATRLAQWLHELHLAGFSWQPSLPDAFFITISNKTLLPLLLLGIMLLFMYYTKRVSNERQPVMLSFIAFSATYWALGGLCWLLALYHYITKRPVRWGPRLYTH